MNDVGDLTGRYHELFEYFGPEDADLVTIVMSSSSETCIETIKYMNKHEGKKWGFLMLQYEQPWSKKDLLAKIPKSCKKISVLDKTNEEGCAGNPLWLDVLSTTTEFRPEIKVVGGVYGIASKNFEPN
jgi:pyruvate-ferredoxin/flavodoxin oxidoreductase